MLKLALVQSGRGLSRAELISNQKIESVFHAFRYSISVEKDGRKFWPKKFKCEMGQRMKSSTLSDGEVQKICWGSAQNLTRFGFHSVKVKKKANCVAPKPRHSLGFAEIRASTDEPHSKTSEDLEQSVPTRFLIFRSAVREEVLVPVNWVRTNFSLSFLQLFKQDCLK